MKTQTGRRAVGGVLSAGEVAAISLFLGSILLVSVVKPTLPVIAVEISVLIVGIVTLLFLIRLVKLILVPGRRIRGSKSERANQGLMVPLLMAFTSLCATLCGMVTGETWITATFLSLGFLSLLLLVIILQARYTQRWNF